MSNIGKLEIFDENTDDISTYLLRLKHYIKTNSIKDEQKVSVLLTVLGSKVVKLLQDLLAPDEVDSKSYVQLVKTLTSHFKPKKLLIVERYKFNSRIQKEDETISDYVVAIKNMATTCNFGNFLQDALRDRLVSGLKEENIRLKLLTEELDFVQTYERARMLEEATKSKDTFNQEQQSVSKIDYKFNKRLNEKQRETNDSNYKSFNSKQNLSRDSCYRCGSRFHMSSKCKYQNYKCNNCLKMGHLASVCRNRNKKSSVKLVDENDSSSSDEIKNINLYSIYHVSAPSAYKINLKINNQILNMDIDTGAFFAIMSEKMYKENFPNVKLSNSDDIKLTAYWFKEPLPLCGKIKVKVQYGNVFKNLEAIIIKSGARSLPSLMGRDWLEQLDINWSQSIHVVNESNCQNFVTLVKDKFADVFNKNRGGIKDYEAKLVLKGNPTPVFCKTRPLPYSLKPAVEAELKRLVEGGV